MEVIVKCLECNNQRNFIIFLNQTAKVSFDNKSELRKINKETTFPDIYPIICGDCDSDKIDFDFKEVGMLINKINQ